MNTKANDGSPFDLAKILNAARQITAFEVVLVSVISLPWLAGAWFVVLDRLEIGLDGKRWGLGIAAAVYVIGVILALVERHRRIIAEEARKEAEEAKEKAEEAKKEEFRRREAAKNQILAYLDNLEKTTGHKIAFNERIREKVDPSYSDEFLDSLVKDFSTILAKRKRKSDGKVGLARL